MASNLPDYVASAQPNSPQNRVPWYMSTAQTYAGIMLWFVFWQDIPAAGGSPGGALVHGLFYALSGLVLAALLCHFLFYLVPGLLGMKTGLPLYIVGTSTYGVLGGFIMPGFLMGLLQFGWLSVNAFFSGLLLVAPFYDSLEAATMTNVHLTVSVVWAIVAAFVGLKGIKYVAAFASFLPLIPFVILLVLFAMTCTGIPDFDGAAAAAATTTADAVPLSVWGVVAAMLVYVVGFFATAGAAGTDFGMNNRDGKDVQLGGIVGIAGATVFAGGMSLLIVVGALGKVSGTDKFIEMSGNLQTTAMMSEIMGAKTGAVFMYLLAIAAFPPACFSSFIAANSFKTTLSKVNPFVSVGLGTAASILLIVSGKAGEVVSVFVIIGASFGPICGAMAADYLLAGRKWAGPRGGFNPAGWISWALGFLVGGFGAIITRPDFELGLVQVSDWSGVKFATSGFAKVLTHILYNPAPPVAAFVVGFVVYALLAKIGMTTKTFDMPAPKPEEA